MGKPHYIWADFTNDSLRGHYTDSRHIRQVDSHNAVLTVLRSVQNKNLTAIWPILPGRAELIIPNDEGPDVMLPPGLLNCA
jgi:hypothetical protein